MRKSGFVLGVFLAERLAGLRSYLLSYRYTGTKLKEILHQDIILDKILKNLVTKKDRVMKRSEDNETEMLI